MYKSLEDLLASIKYKDEEFNTHIKGVITAAYNKAISERHKEEDAIILSMIAFTDEMQRLGFTA